MILMVIVYSNREKVIADRAFQSRRSTLFPYTTLFRSYGKGKADVHSRRITLHRRVDKLSDLGERNNGIQILRSPRSEDRKSTRLNSSHVSISYAVFCLNKKTKHQQRSLLTCISTS